MKRLIPYTGPILIGGSVLHLVVGAIFYAEPLGDILRAGMVNAIGTNAARDGALWFMVCGIILLQLGVLVRWTQQRTGTIPPFLGWSMLALSLVGMVLMPASGFGLMILIGLLLIAAARAAQPETLSRS
jgi:hypothetical protein